MSMKFGLALPQGTLMELAGINDPVEAYETMTQVALTAEETGFDSLWLSDAFWPGDSSQILFECWTTTAALARDTTRVRIGQLVTKCGQEAPGFQPWGGMAAGASLSPHQECSWWVSLSRPGQARAWEKALNSWLIKRAGSR